MNPDYAASPSAEETGIGTLYCTAPPLYSWSRKSENKKPARLPTTGGVTHGAGIWDLDGLGLELKPCDVHSEVLALLR